MSSTEPVTNDKAEAIIRASLEAFRLYGFKKASMADIAERAGMSRAALYLHFRNKEDIFAHLMRTYFETAANEMERALAEAADAQAALQAAFRAKVAPPFDQLMDSPHGAELLEAKTAAGGNIIEEGDRAIVAVLTVWLAQSVQAGRISLDPLGGSAREVAQVILAAVHGVVSEASTYQALLEDLDRLAVMFARSLIV